MDLAAAWIMTALLAVAVALHLHHLLTGAQTFWVFVTVVMTLFCLVSAVQLMGATRALVFFAVGVTLGLGFEVLSIRTGFPFGPYHYNTAFGPKVWGVPYIIPLAWFVIVYLGFVLANLMIAHRPVTHDTVGRAAFLSLVGAGIVTAYDLACDPFMIQKIGAWTMHNAGEYFGEQLRGFYGWTLVSFLIGFLVRLAHRRLPAWPPTTAPVLAAAYPLLAYGLWWLFFSVAGFPMGTRVIATYAMGLPTLAAAAGLLAWRRAQRVPSSHVAAW
jgi:putative membrane protein